MFNTNIENPSLYSLYELGKLSTAPVTVASRVMTDILRMPRFPMSRSHLGRATAASFEMADRMTRHYPKPAWNIKYSKTEQGIVEVTEEVAVSKTFCRLLHFKKNIAKIQEKLLIIAPMAGHYSTLLRGTVEDLLPYFDVYITDWENARDVPIFEGPFSLTDHVDYTLDFMRFFGGDVTVLAVCQPTVSAMVAASYLSYHKEPGMPKNLIVVGGPIDARCSPTQINDFAVDRSLLWFSSNYITRVPLMYAGASRRVYPGFLQLGGFMSMNMNRHIGSHVELFQNLVRGDGDGADKRRQFYDEYLATMDLPAEFYLQTIDEVFHKYSLPRGRMIHRNTPINMGYVNNTRLLAIEGELDDIAGIGQTKAAISLCKQLPPKNKTYYLQKGVGHYGTFNGRKFRECIVPVIRDFVSRGKKTRSSNVGHHIANTNHGRPARMQFVAKK